MVQTRKASASLEAFMDLCHEKAREAGFKGPSAFRGMRTKHGTWLASKMLVESGALQDGLEWARDNGLLAYTVEAGVIKFADEFDPATVQCAKWRLALMEKAA